jgi:N-acetylmuramoyl-L-alanine amidase
MINDANMLESVNLAKKIQKSVCRTAGRLDKGVKQDAFLVLRETSMPACLIELGYITSPSEEAYLTSKSGVDALARGIYQAFVEYKSGKTGAAAEPAKPTPEASPQEKKVEAPAADKLSDTKGGGQAGDAGAIVFKVQFLTSDRKLASTDSRLKGLKDADCYKEGGLWKYTVGGTTNYSEIQKLRRDVAKKFPQAFIAAFRDGKRMDLDEAKKAVGVR